MTPNSISSAPNAAHPVRILAIETSCDETAAAIIDDGRIIRSNIVASQIALHQQYGGVFPEMASRAHIESIYPTIQQAVQEANVSWESISAVAVTRGPGLPGSLVVGVNAAKGVCLARGLPLIGVNHLEGHIYAHWLTGNRWTLPPGSTPADLPPLLGEGAPPFPLIVLIVSGGHTELVLMRGHGQYELVGATVDDAAGEAFDKVARALGLGYPGGPEIEKIARQGNPARFRFSKPRISSAGRGGAARLNEGQFDFSFSGTKTATLQLIHQFSPKSSHLSHPDGREPDRVSVRVPVSDIAASFQDAVVDWLTEKAAKAVEIYGARAVLVGGGVSANSLLRDRMAGRLKVPVSFPPLHLCTDNAAMIGAAAHYAYIRGVRDALDMDVNPDLNF